MLNSPYQNNDVWTIVAITAIIEIVLFIISLCFSRTYNIRKFVAVISVTVLLSGAAFTIIALSIKPDHLSFTQHMSPYREPGSETDFNSFIYKYYDIGIGVAIAAITEIVLFLIAFLFNDNKKKTIRAIAAIIGVIVLLAGAIFSVIALNIKNTFTTVPKIANHKREQAIEVLAKSDLDTDLNNFIYRNQPVPADDLGLVVRSTDPKEGSLLKKNSSVIVYMAKIEDLIKAIPISKNDSANIKEKVYNDVYLDNLYPLNATEFTLNCNRKSLDIIVDDKEFNRVLSSEPISGVKVQLFNFVSNELIRELVSGSDGTVKFKNLNDGIYYYKVMIDGYKIMVTENPFKLQFSPNTEHSVLSWAVDLEKIGSEYTNEFKIKLIKKSGKPIVNKEIYVRTMNENNSYEGYSSLPMKSNKDGYLTLWHAIDSVDYYDIVTFKLNSEYRLEVYSDNKVATIDTSQHLSEYEVVFE